MFLLKGREDGPGSHDLPLPGGGAALPASPKKRSPWQALTGEEQPRSMASLLLILVCSVHLWGALWLLQPVEPVTMAKPLMMEVSLVSAPGKQQTTAPPAPPKPVEPVKPKKSPVKKALKQKPAKPKQAQRPKPMMVPEELLPVPAESAAELSDSKNAPAISNATVSASGTQGEAEPYSEASFNADYGTNPKPLYPSIARSRGWQGKVLLRVSVSAEGRSVSVTVQRSSGHDMLDESAVAAVEKWQFIPAKRGNTPVASSVIVPIVFILNH